MEEWAAKLAMCMWESDVDLGLYAKFEDDIAAIASTIQKEN